MLESEKITTVRYRNWVISWWSAEPHTYKRKQLANIKWVFNEHSMNPYACCGTIEDIPAEWKTEDGEKYDLVLGITDDEILDRITTNLAQRWFNKYDYEILREIKALSNEGIPLAEQADYVEAHEDEIAQIDLHEDRFKI